MSTIKLPALSLPPHVIMAFIDLTLCISCFVYEISFISVKESRNIKEISRKHSHSPMFTFLDVDRSPMFTFLDVDRKLRTPPLPILTQ